MQITRISIADTDYTALSKLDKLHQEQYLENKILSPTIKWGYGFYGIVDIQNNHVDVRIGDTCD